MSIKTGDLPAAIVGEPVNVVGTQGDVTVQLALPPAATNPVATRRDMDAGTSSTTQVTPAAIFPIIQGLRSQAIINWKVLGSNSYTVTASAKAAITGVAAKTTENILTATFSNFRTFLPFNNMRVFYDDASGVPSVPGDTLQFGMLLGTEGRSGQGGIVPRGRLAISFWQNLGGIVHRRAGAGTQGDPYRWEILPLEDVDYINNAYDAPQLHGWLPLTPQAIEIQGQPESSYGFVSNGRDELVILTMREESSGVYAVQTSQNEYRTPRADITGEQVVTALSSLTGANRLDAQYVKNLAAGEEGNGVPNNDSVSTIKIQDMAVTNAKIADATITPAKFSTTGVVSGQVMRFVDGVWKSSNETAVDSIGEGTINAASLATGAVTSRSVADDAITSSKIADAAVTEDRIASNAVVQSKIANNSVGLAEIDPSGSSANQILGIDSGGDPAWVNPASVSTVADGAITEGKIASNSVSQAKMKDDSVGTPQIIAGAVTGNELGSAAVSADKIAHSAIGVAHISPAGTANQVLTMNAAGTAAEWRNSQAAIDSLADGAVVTDKIANNAVTAAKIAPGAVTATEIGGGAVVAAKIGPDAVDSTKIADNAIGTEHINVSGQTDGYVLKVSGSTAAWQDSVLANNTVTADKIRNGAILNAKIANDAVTDNKIADGAVSVDKLSNDAVETAKIKDGNVTLAKISTTGATANQIIKMNSAGTAWETSAESAQTKGVTLVDTLIALNAAHGDLPVGGQIRIGTSFTDTPNALTYRRGETYRKTLTSWQNVSQVIDGSTLQNNSIVAAHLRSDSVTRVKIADKAVDTPQIEDNAITLSKMADGSVSGDQITADAVPVSKMSAEGGTNDYFIARKNGEVVWQRRVVADNLAPTPVTATFLSLDSNLVPIWDSPYPSGYANGLMLGYAGDRIQWIARPSWSDLGGGITSGYQNTSPNRIITGTITTGLDFTDYDEIEIVGKDLCWTMIVSGPTWNASSATAPIRIHEHAQVYRTSNNTYALATTDTVDATNGTQYAITRLRGKRWPAAQ